MLWNKKVGDIIDLTVYDYFTGRVRLLKKTRRKIYVEIIDVTMCYPSAHELPAGKREWVPKELIFLPPSRFRIAMNNAAYKIRRIFGKKKNIWEGELPF